MIKNSGVSSGPGGQLRRNGAKAPSYHVELWPTFVEKGM